MSIPAFRLRGWQTASRVLDSGLLAMIVQQNRALEIWQEMRVHLMGDRQSERENLLQSSGVAERALIDAEAQAEREMQEAEERYRRATEKLELAQQRVLQRRREFEQARARLDQCQLERAAGPVIRRITVERPSLPRPARDDSRSRSRRPKTQEPAPESAGSIDADVETKG